MTRYKRELLKLPITRITTTRGGHLRLKLTNGRCVFVASTPSDRRAWQRVRRDVKKELMK